MVAEDATDRPGQAALTQTFALLVKKTGHFTFYAGRSPVVRQDWRSCGARQPPYSLGLRRGNPLQPLPPFMHQLAIHIGAVDGSVIPQGQQHKELVRRVVELS